MKTAFLKLSPRRFFVGIAVCIALGIGLFAALSWLTRWRFIEATNNAYVRADIVAVSPKVSGYVASVEADDNAVVAAGDVLLRIEETEFEQRVAAKSAQIAGIEAQIQSIISQKEIQAIRISELESDQLVAEAEEKQAIANLRRADSLIKKDAIASQKYEGIETDRVRAKGSKSKVELQFRAAQLEFTMLLAEEDRLNAQKREAQADLVILSKQLDDTIIRAPVSGVVGNKAIQQGEFVTPGKFLLAIIDLDSVWIEANFKETQLRRMSVGQAVSISVDAYPGHRFDGVVESVSPATGSQFSLLPAENASGNFTKIVQRLPVRIAIDNATAADGALRPGMSTEVSVMTKSHSDTLPQEVTSRREHVSNR